MTTSRTARRTAALAAAMSALLFASPAIGAAHASDGHHHGPTPPREARPHVREPVTVVEAARTAREPRTVSVGAL